MTVADDPRRAINEVKTGGAKFFEGKAHPITAERADRAAKGTDLASHTDIREAKNEKRPNNR